LRKFPKKSTEVFRERNSQRIYHGCISKQNYKIGDFVSHKINCIAGLRAEAVGLVYELRIVHDKNK
jgi:hypothetical protein